MEGHGQGWRMVMRTMRGQFDGRTWTRVEDGNEDNAGTIRWKDMDKGGGW